MSCLSGSILTKVKIGGGGKTCATDNTGKWEANVGSHYLILQL